VSEANNADGAAANDASSEARKHSDAGRGALYLAASNIYFIFAGMAIQFGLPAVLSRDVFGAYTQVNSIASWINNVLVTGTIQAVSRGSAAEPEKARATEDAGLRMHLRIRLGLAVLFVLGAPAVAWFLHDTSKIAPLMLAGVIVGGYAFYAVFVGTANGLHRFGVQAGLTVVFATIRAAALIGMGVIGAGVVGVIGGWVAAVAVILVLTVLWVGLPGKIAAAARQPVAPMVKYFARVAIYLAFFNAIMFVDNILLKRILSEHLASTGLAAADVAKLSDVQVGYYGAVQNLARLSYQVLIAATFVAFPLVSRSTFANDKAATKQYVGVISRYSLIAGALIAVVMAAVPSGVLGLVYAPDFVAAGSAALPFLALGNIAFSLIAVAGAILNGAGETRAASITVAITLVVAIVGGLGPSIAAALTSAFAYNFFFTEPLYTFTIDAQQNVLTFFAMIVVGVSTALVVDYAARRATQAARARTEATLLASYARTVLTNPYPLARLLEKVKENFGLTSVALLERVDGAWDRVACVGASPCDEPDDADVDIAVTPEVHLALRGRSLPASDRRVLEAAAGQALLALRQQRMAEQTLEAQRQASRTELRTALLSAVGHDLRTPLTSIKASVGSLRDPELRLSESDTAELLEAVEESADRLTALVDNLLDSSRLATGAVEPQFRAVGYYEAVARALSGLNGDIEVDVPESLPPVRADVGLLERVIANVVGNALRYAGAVALGASAHGSDVELRVVDHGRGLPSGTAQEVFAPFQRLGDRTPGGVGLGLSVAKGFTEAMDGTITMEDTPGGGLTVVISLPADERAS